MKTYKVRPPVVAFFELEPPLGTHQNYGIDPRNAKTPEYGFDWKMTYERDSDVVVSYVPKYHEGFNRFPNVVKSNAYFALLLVSNCNPESNFRLEYAHELMKHIPVMSAGKCMNNMITPIAELFPECNNERKCYVSKFKFILSFENSHFHDYVTEKYFDVLGEFCMPVLLID
jgi:hypothetical protein